MTANIHPAAHVAPEARLAEGVTVGPGAVIGPDVSIGAGTSIGPGAIIEGHTTIGRDNQIYGHAVVGSPPQDKKYEGTPTLLRIGDRNVIREFVTINPGTEQDRGETTIGNGNLLMAYVHVAHDCLIGNDNVLANTAQLAGHVEIGDFVTIGGMSGIHQFVRLGDHAMVGGGSMVTLDVPPYCTAVGNRARLHGLNLIGLQRRGFDADAIQRLKQAYRMIFRDGLRFKEALQQVRDTFAGHADVMKLVTFLESSERGVARPGR
ncbi:MAG: acyl-ACP--UDP-N-acetylglucosamine O-acyltransferase [Candidatus Dadabacteria bacterium]|nr:MAG: acyl-ACP--UDP-N-acetylglucosamine O-acyltransferase [Candidatus Dadabacteria bacterium]